MSNDTKETRYANARDILNIRARRAYNYAVNNLGKSRLGALKFAGDVLRTYNYVPAHISQAVLAL